MKTLTLFILPLLLTSLALADSSNELPNSGSEGIALYRADEVRVYKSARKIEMLYLGKVVKTYIPHLSKGGLKPKRQEGDMLVPEGKYTLDYKNPYSKYYKSLHVSYPNEEDIKRAHDAGVEPGGDIMLHGYPNNIIARLVARSRRNWTRGCMAFENEEMEQIYNSLEVPTPITIYP